MTAPNHEPADWLDQRRAEVESELADAEDHAEEALPEGWQRQAHHYAAQLHRSAAQARARAAALHALEVDARRQHPIH